MLCYLQTLPEGQRNAYAGGIRNNEEFEWNKDLLEDASPTSGPAERITEEKVRAAIAKAKVSKAAGSTGLCSVGDVNCIR